jgi:hypothetical protein
LHESHNDLFMRHILLKLKDTFPALNRREFKEEDCWRFVREQGITVKRAPLEVDGYTGKAVVRRQKRYYILLDEKLSGIHFLRAFLHEIGHVVLHEPRGASEVLYLKRENALESQQEAEADVFMLLAMIPKKRYLELKKTPPDELHPFTAELLLRREELFTKIRE